MPCKTRIFRWTSWEEKGRGKVFILNILTRPLNKASSYAGFRGLKCTRFSPIVTQFVHSAILLLILPRKPCFGFVCGDIAALSGRSTLVLYRCVFATIWVQLGSLFHATYLTQCGCCDSINCTSIVLTHLLFYQHLISHLNGTVCNHQRWFKTLFVSHIRVFFCCVFGYPFFIIWAAKVI